MAIRESITGYTRFVRRPIASSRIVEKPEAHFFMFGDYRVEIKPPDRISYMMRRKLSAPLVAQTIVGDDINENATELTFPKFKLPIGIVEVRYSFIDDAELEADLASQRPGSTTVVISDDGSEASLAIRQCDGSIENFTVPTAPLVTLDSDQSG